ncbi:unnamed protein product [Prunus armeniaca]
MDNLHPKLLISKQAIVNLGEEYLPKRERPTLKKTKEGWTLISAWIAAFDHDWIGIGASSVWKEQKWLDLIIIELELHCRIGASSVWKGQKWLDLIITELELHCSTCFAWIAAFDPDWTGYVCAGLNYQHLQLSSFSCKSIPTFEFGRAVIYFKPGKAF